MLADLQMLAVYAQDSAQRLFELPARKPPSLSEQERDVLFWLARRKSPLSVSLMLGMTEVEVQLHVDRTQRKFGVDSLGGAIEAARSFGLL
jgi:DNA-binding CsgD family transcriptional regulator